MSIQHGNLTLTRLDPEGMKTQSISNTGVMTGPAISYDKVRQLPWEANTSNDSVIVLITVGASTLGLYGGLHVSCL